MLETIFQILMALAVIGVGLLAGYGAVSFAWTDIRAWAGYLASRNWQPAAGRVELSNVRVIGLGRRPAYEPEVRYIYTVAGQVYSGERLTFSSWADWSYRGDVERALEPYPPGAAVEVFYNPSHPEESVLERRPPRGRIMPWFVVLLLLWTTVMCVVAGGIGLLNGP